MMVQTIRQEGPLQIFSGQIHPYSWLLLRKLTGSMGHIHMPSFCSKMLSSYILNVLSRACFVIFCYLEAGNFQNHQVLVLFCLTVSSSIYVFLLTSHHKQQGETRPHCLYSFGNLSSVSKLISYKISFLPNSRRQFSKVPATLNKSLYFFSVQ